MKHLVKNLKSMMESCFTYGGLEPDSYNYQRYILPYRAEMGAKLFDKTYKQYAKELKENYTVETGVYQDCDGLTYNSLIKKQ